MVYCTSCRRCPSIYIKQGRTLRQHFGEHLRSIEKNLPGFPVAEHFSTTCHSIHNALVRGIMMLCGENVQRKRLEMRLIYQLRTSHPRGLNSVSSRLTREHGICKHCNVSYVLSNSTDERPGPGPKRLEKISNQNTALLFIIFLFLLLNIPLRTF